VVIEGEAEFRELAFEILVRGVEFWFATCGKLLGQLEKAGSDGMAIDVVVHG
jgi:hypothetical protein